MSLTDPFGISPFSWSALGYGLLTALGFIPYIGDVFDLINAARYAKEVRYEMAAKYVQAVTKVVHNA